MASLNRAEVIGNLGKDPEVRRTQDGTPVASISVATNEQWKDKNTGQDREEVEWHRVVLWNRLAEIAEQYLRQGNQVFIAGKLKTRKWTDKSGVERYSTEIVARELVMLGSREGGGNRAPHPAEQYAPPEPAQQTQPAQQQAADEDDLPF